MDLKTAFRYVVRGRPSQDDRPALPAGHPDTWGTLTDGTMLEGSAYPIPPFLPRRDDASHRRLLALADSILSAD